MIFQNIDRPKNTVNLISAIKRLQNISNIYFDQTDIDTIVRASIIRNKIVHYEIELNAKELKLLFAKLLGFSAEFHKSHLSSHLSDHIEYDIWQDAVSILDYAEELYNRALAEFKEKGFEPLHIWMCPHCEMDAFVTEDEINTCYVCGFKADTHVCPDCGEVTFLDECHELQINKYHTDYFCTECYEKRIWDDDAYYHDKMAHFFYK